MNSKISSLKEKMRQALTSTMKVISEDFKLKNEDLKEASANNSGIAAIDALSSPQDFIRLRAEFDSRALEKKFSNPDIFKNNLPKNSSCRSLYTIAEKTRYELLGCQMLKELKKILMKIIFKKST